MPALSIVFNPPPPDVSAPRGAHPEAAREAEAESAAVVAVQSDRVTISKKARRLFAAQEKQSARNETAPEYSRASEEATPGGASDSAQKPSESAPKTKAADFPIPFDPPQLPPVS